MAFSVFMLDKIFLHFLFFLSFSYYSFFHLQPYRLTNKEQLAWIMALGVCRWTSKSIESFNILRRKFKQCELYLWCCASLSSACWELDHLRWGDIQCATEIFNAVFWILEHARYSDVIAYHLACSNIFYCKPKSELSVGTKLEGFTKL